MPTIKRQNFVIFVFDLIKPFVKAFGVYIGIFNNVRLLYYCIGHYRGRVAPFKSYHFAVVRVPHRTFRAERSCRT